MPELMNYIRDFSGEGGSLPLLHSTDSFLLKKIRQTGKLQPAEDSVYDGEKLLYMFYGRPSYRVNPAVKHTHVSYFAPICMIFNRSLMGEACRIMPFDTGAHKAGRLDETIHKQMDRKEFELEINMEAPMKLIRCFYGSEARYAESAPDVSNPDIEVLQNEQQHYPEAYYQLIYHRPNTDLDERVNTIEVQFNIEIPIAGQCSAVILPSRFFSPELIQEIETDLGATCIPYDLKAVFKPTEIVNTIYEKVRWFLQQDSSDAR